MRAHVTKKTKALLLNSPTNPTGAVYSERKLKEIAEFATDYNLYVISDEVYEKLVYDDACHFSIGSINGMEDRTFTVNSFSKTYAMTGWRIGYVAFPDHIANALLTIHQNLVICAPSVAQWACVEALASSQECVETMQKEYSQRRALVAGRLSTTYGFGSARPKGTFYAFPSIRSLVQEKGDSIRKYLQTKEVVPACVSEQVSDFLFYKCKIITVAGNIFGNHGDYYIRIAFTRTQQELKEAFDRIVEAVKEI
jgi:aminotransferase